MTDFLWSGGALVRDGEDARVGNLFLTREALYFVEAGPAGGRFGAAPALLGAAAVLLGIPLFIEGYAALWLDDRGVAPLVAEVVAGLTVLALLVLSWRTARAARAEVDAAMKRLGEPSEPPDPAFLEDWCGRPGCFRLAAADVEEVEPEGEDGLRLRTRLDDRLGLRVAPDRDGLVAALRSGSRTPR